jgi:FAD/FMN-containing dehydrogenase
MESLFKALTQFLEGEVKSDIISRKAYSVDASIYEVEPIGIVIPKTVEDILNTIRVAADYKVPIIPRGAATGITGSCLGKGLIMDTSKYLHRILEINYEESYALCEPGVVQDQLNQALSAKGYRLGPDTSTGNRATLGGMLANNAAGARSLRYGKMVDHVREVELALAHGEIIKFSPLNEMELQNKLILNNAESHIYREVIKIKNQYRDEIERRFPKIDRRVSGYNLDELIKTAPLNLSRLIAGSEGTLGIATKIKMQISQKPKASCLCIIHFSDLLQSMYAIEDILPTHPMALEMIDHHIIESAKTSPNMQGKLSWIQGEPACLFIVEYDGENSEEAVQKANLLKHFLERQRIGYSPAILKSPAEIAHVWEVRKAGLGLLLSKRTYSRAIAFIEDISIPPKNLPAFLGGFLEYLKSQGKQAGIYGHVGSGCMHVRPYINLREESEVKLMRQMMLDVSDMIVEYGGALSGEHGDGLIRSWLNKKMFGEEIYEAFIKLKQAFDPAYR